LAQPNLPENQTFYSGINSLLQLAAIAMPISYFFDMKIYPIEITINNFNWGNQSNRRV
jgi:hypothetical protein